MGFFEFLKTNYIWLLVVLILLIITIIGFFADRRDKNKKKNKENKEESKPVDPNLVVPTVAMGAEANKKEEPATVQDTPKIISEPTVNVNTLNTEPINNTNNNTNGVGINPVNEVPKLNLSTNSPVDLPKVTPTPVVPAVETIEPTPQVLDLDAASKNLDLNTSVNTNNNDNNLVTPVAEVTNSWDLPKVEETPVVEAPVTPTVEAVTSAPQVSDLDVAQKQEVPENNTQTINSWDLPKVEETPAVETPVTPTVEAVTSAPQVLDLDAASKNLDLNTSVNTNNNDNNLVTPVAEVTNSWDLPKIEETPIAETPVTPTVEAATPTPQVLDLDATQKQEVPENNTEAINSWDLPKVEEAPIVESPVTPTIETVAPVPNNMESSQIEELPQLESVSNSNLGAIHKPISPEIQEALSNLNPTEGNQSVSSSSEQTKGPERIVLPDENKTQTAEKIDDDIWKL